MEYLYYMKGEKWPHEHGEMYIGKYTIYIDPMGFWSHVFCTELL